MTSEELIVFCDRLEKRFPFYRLNDEVRKTLASCFRNFGLDVAERAIHQYAVQDPDLNLRTFKIKALMAICFDLQEQEQEKFSWSAADEAGFYMTAFAWRVPDLTIDEYALHILGKPRVPTLNERDKAAKVLKDLGAKTPEYIARLNDENNRAYDRYRSLAQAAQAELRRRNRSQAQSERAQQEAAGEAQPASTYLDRARQLIAERATS